MPASSLQRRVLNIFWKHREFLSKSERFLRQHARLERRNRHSNAGALERENEKVGVAVKHDFNCITMTMVEYGLRLFHPTLAC
jgi:hypothetical protein